MTILSRMLERNYLIKGQDSAGRDTTLPVVGCRSLLRSVVSVWEALLDSAAPIGYEDETGFHYGPPTS